jgi:hypothetical protein
MTEEEAIQFLLDNELLPSKTTYVPCFGCGYKMHWEAYGNYRWGWWCSRACAYY